MAEQGSYPLNGRTLQGTDTCTGVVSGQTADIPLSALGVYLLGAIGAGQVSGTTAVRNAIVPTYVGQSFFDTTLGYMMWVKQISPPIWVNASGFPQ